MGCRESKPQEPAAAIRAEDFGKREGAKRTNSALDEQDAIVIAPLNGDVVKAYKSDVVYTVRDADDRSGVDFSSDSGVGADGANNDSTVAIGRRSPAIEQSNATQCNATMHCL